MYSTEFRQLNDAELVTKFLDLKEELFNLRFQNATGSLEKHNLIPSVKKEIARVQTVLTERGLNASNDSSSLSVSDPSDPANVRSDESSEASKKAKVK